MIHYTPDGWTVLKFAPDNGEAPYYKVFASWIGGYLSGDSWRLSSGAKDLNDAYLENEVLCWPQSSGSLYCIRLEDEGGTSFYTSNVMSQIIRESNEMDIPCELVLLDQVPNLDERMNLQKNCKDKRRS